MTKKKSRSKNTKKNNKGGGPSRKPTNLEDEIIKLLNSKPQNRYTVKQIANSLRVRDIKGKNQIASIAEKLVEEKKLNKLSNRHYASNREALEVIGTVDYVNPKYVFVIPDLDPDAEEDAPPAKDIKVDARDVKQALHGDKVKVKIYSTSGRSPGGKIVKILERVKTTFVGTIEILDKYAFVEINERKMFQDIFVPLNALNGAENGQKVLVEMDEWGPRDKNPTGRVVRVLGDAGEHDTEIHSIMFEFGLPFEFPNGLENIAKKIPEDFSPKTIAKRRDMRSITTFTIDPLTAKDFDDALSIQKLENGNWEIGVHIADVTHYVTPGTPVADEAKKRATSVYLVDRTIPMLPERLSNELCSLRPNEDKLTFSAVFELNEEGQLQNEWFGRTVTHSDRRFTYEEAQERIETQQGDYFEEITILNALAKKMQKRRFEQGAISFETVEFEFKLDEDGKTPLGMVAKERKDAHKLIEEFMLLANKRVATFIFEKKKVEPRLSMVYRIHEPPNPEKVSEFALFAKQFGYQLDARPNKLAHSINKLTQEIQGKPEQNALEIQAIKTMSKAKYTTQPLGHYGLGFEHYTHFTSPIRRYPDMMVHRLLQHYLNDGASPKRGDLEETCKHASAMEKRAADAERASVKYKQIEYMQQFVGTEMAGTIISLTDWGMYIELEETRCEGMARLADISGDYYQHDAEKQQVTGINRGKVFKLGDPVRIIISRASPTKRELDLEIVMNK